MRSNVILMEICKDFDVKIRGYTNKPKYPVVKKLLLDSNRSRINLDQVKEKFEALQQRYPNKGYYLVREEITYRLARDIQRAGGLKLNVPKHKRVMWVLGRKEENRKGIPVYVSTTLRKIFVPSSYVRSKYRLTCSVVSYRLRDLGIPYRMAYAS